MLIEEYKGYKIWNNTKTVNHYNSYSGRHYTTHEVIEGYHISGPKAPCLEVFSSVEKAKEQIDFVVKYLVPYNC